MKNISVSITRVLAMIFIILCHLSSWLGLNAFAMLFNVGVEIFLLISGYLYANRKIENSISFLKKRWEKLCIPMYVLLFILLGFSAIGSTKFISLSAVPFYLLNLQGFGFIISKLQLPQINALGHLWFLTAIMFCYVLLILIKKLEETFLWNNKPMKYTFYVFVLIFSFFIAIYGIQLAYFVAFFIGYELGKVTYTPSIKSYTLTTFLMLFAMGIRLFSRRVLDGTIFYNEIIVLYTHIILAVWIYFTIQVFYQGFPSICDKICNNKFWIWIEQHSMMIYMTHYIFLVGEFDVAKLSLPVYSQLLCFILLTLGSACILKTISDRITKIFL